MKKWTAAALAALTALTLTGCSFQDVMLYLYGGDQLCDKRRAGLHHLRRR